MPTIVLAMVLGFAAFFPPTSKPETPSKVSVSLDITNIPKIAGSMRVAIFSKAVGFRDEEFATQKFVFPVTALRETFTFKDLAPGRYAVAIYHDSNDNGKLDTNFFGIPTESYGFSNNVMGTFGPPSFEAASFQVLSGNKVVPIKLR